MPRKARGQNRRVSNHFAFSAMKRFSSLLSIAALCACVTGCGGAVPNAAQSPSGDFPAIEAAIPSEAAVLEDSVLFEMNSRGGAAIRGHDSTHVLFDGHHVGAGQLRPVSKKAGCKCGKAKKPKAKAVHSAGKAKGQSRKDRSIYSKPVKKPVPKASPRSSSMPKAPDNSCSCDC